MMKYQTRMKSLLLVLVGVCGLLVGCKKEPAKALISAPADLNKPGMIIGVPQGAASMTVSEAYFKEAQVQYFGALTDGYMAVWTKRIDAFAFDRQNMIYAARQNPDLAILDEGLRKVDIVVGIAPKHPPKLLDEINSFIARYRADGTYEDMYARWVKKGDLTMPSLPFPENPTRHFIVAAEGLNEPMNFFGAKGQLTGFDIEFAYRLAYDLNATIEFTSADFGGMIAGVQSGKIDLLISNLNATPERREQMTMSQPYLVTDIALMVHKDNLAPKPIHSIDDMSGKFASYSTGSAFPMLVDPCVKGKKINWVAFDDFPVCVQALLAGKVDATFADEPVARAYVASYKGKLHLAEIFIEDYYGYAFPKGSPLTQKVNLILAKLKDEGFIEKLKEKWCNGDLENKQLEVYTHNPNFTGHAGHIRFATDPGHEPMMFIGPDGKNFGLDVDLVNRIAYELDMTVEYLNQSISSLVESIRSGRADMMGGSISITPERAEKVDFCEAYYDGGVALVVRKEGNHRAITTLKDLKGRRVGVLSGTTMDAAAKESIPNAKIIYYTTFADQPIALAKDKIETFLMEEPMAQLLVSQKPGFSYLKEPLSTFNYAMVFPPKSVALASEFSVEIKRLAKDGTLDHMKKKWFTGNSAKKLMPTPLKNPPRGVLKYATVPELEPFTFYIEGELAGYDIETLVLCANKLGYGLEPVICTWDSYLEAVSTGKADLGIACTAVTPERQQKMLFSEPYCASGLVAVVKDAKPEEVAPVAVSFVDGLKSSFDRTFIRESRWKLIAEGLGVTILITIFSALFGTLLAFGVCALRRSKNRILCTIGKVYISLIQGTPILVILMILYYIVFASWDINAIFIAIIGFSLNFAAYVGEMFRAGIESIPKGQSEAAAALGFTRFAAFRKVIFPQVLIQILPIYRGAFIDMLKMTSIVGDIAIQDLTQMSDIIRSRTYEAFFPLIAAALIYLAVANIFTPLLVALEKYLDPRNRRAKAKKGGAQ